MRLWKEKPYADLWNTLHQLAALLQDQMELKTFTDETAAHHNGPFMKARAAAFFPSFFLFFILSFFYECKYEPDLSLARSLVTAL